jgi:multidrug efflux pump subunit AcrB
VAEVYGPSQEERTAIARRIRDLWKRTAGVVDVDWYVEDDQPKARLVVDRDKAALSGISEDDVARTVQAASAGYPVELLHVDSEKEDVPILVRLDRPTRSSVDGILSLKVAGRGGQLVALRELVRSQPVLSEKSIYHKNLMPVTYVTGDVAGAMESPVYAILKLGPEMEKLRAPVGYAIEQHMAAQPTDAGRYAMKWDGEWHITYEVFRDLGLAFAAVSILIYGLVVGWFQSFVTPLVIMAAIPFSLVGILPAHGLLHAFFTATSMIGFIAGAGIVVRNSIILVDFIELRLREGMPLDQAVIDAGAAVPSHAADRGGSSGGVGGDPVRPHLSRLGHRADGGRNRFAGSLAHDRAERIFHRESEEGNMSVERYLRLIAGFPAAGVSKNGL